MTNRNVLEQMGVGNSRTCLGEELPACGPFTYAGSAGTAQNRLTLYTRKSPIFTHVGAHAHKTSYTQIKTQPPSHITYIPHPKHAPLHKHTQARKHIHAHNTHTHIHTYLNMNPHTTHPLIQPHTYSSTYTHNKIKLKPRQTSNISPVTFSMKPRSSADLLSLAMLRRRWSEERSLRTLASPSACQRNPTDFLHLHTRTHTHTHIHVHIAHT